MNKFEWNKKNTIIATSVAVYAVLALLLAIIINNEAISKWLGSFFSVLAPLIIGGAIAYLCNPILNMFDNRAFARMRSRKGRRALSLLCTYAVVLLALTLLLLIVIPQLIGSYNSFAGNLQSYTNKAITFVNKALYMINQSAGSDDFSKYIDTGSVQRKVSELFNTSSGIFSTVAGTIVSYASSIAVGIKNVLFGLFISIYVLASKERLSAQTKKILAAALPEKRYKNLLEWVGFTNQTFGSYLKSRIIDAIIIAFICLALFSVCGLPYTLFLSFIIGVTNVIPVFGPFLGGIPAGFIVFISKPEKLLLYVILIVLIQQFDGNVLFPKLASNSTGISSLGVICAIAIMGGYFGILGMLLGVPFFVVAGEIIRRLVNRRLEKRGMSVSLEDYYLAGTAPEAEKSGDNLFMKVFNFITTPARRLTAKIRARREERRGQK